LELLSASLAARLGPACSSSCSAAVSPARRGAPFLPSAGVLPARPSTAVSYSAPSHPSVFLPRHAAQFSGSPAFYPCARAQLGVPFPSSNLLCRAPPWSRSGQPPARIGLQLSLRAFPFLRAQIYFPQPILLFAPVRVCNTLNLGYKFFSLISIKFRYYPLLSLLFFLFS
jgi:hypothetical protein